MKRFACVVAALVVVGSCLFAMAADKPAKAAKAKHAKSAHVYAPFHKLDLTADQRTKIAGIQAEYRAKIKDLEKQENDQIMGLLTDAQKAEIKKQEDEAAKKRTEAAKRYRDAHKKAEEKKGDDKSK